MTEKRAARIFFDKLTDQTVRVNGICNGPLSPEADLSDYYREMKIPAIRFHDTGGDVGRYYIDVSRVFPDFDRNENDPQNYCFDYTDVYIKAAHESGAEIIYRLGESIDDSGIGRYARPPRYFDKWANICVQIIKHYNDGWANGFRYGIKYFEIWNEPDCVQPDGSNPMWTDGTPEQAYELYGAAVKAIKKYDLSLLVGGMAFCTYNKTAEDFIYFCAERRLPLDFLSFHMYGDNPDNVIYVANSFRNKLDSVGFGNTSLILDEWNYIGLERESEVPLWRIIGDTGRTYAQLRREIFMNQAGTVGAAYASAFMTQMQYAGIDIGCYYDGQPNVMRWCGLFDRYGNPQKPFYSFKAFSEISELDALAECATVGGGIYAIAGKGSDGYRVLLTSYRGGKTTLFCEGLPCDKVMKCQIYLLDGTKNLELIGTQTITDDKFHFVLDMAKYSVILLEIK